MTEDLEDKQKSNEYIIINGATAHEFMFEWNRLMKEHNNVNIVWREIAMLFDIEFHPPEIKPLEIEK